MNNELAADLIETKDHWKPEDFVNCFRYLRLNKNDYTDQFTKPTYDDLVKRINEGYEGHRAEALEDFHRKQQGIVNGQAEPRVHETTHFEKLRIENILKKPEYKGLKADESFFEPKPNLSNR